MPEKILLISEKNEDLDLLQESLETIHFDIILTPYYEGIEKRILADGYALILADYDLIRDRAHIFFELQKSLSKAFLIFNGNEFCE